MYDDGDAALPIFCCLYKKLGTNKYCKYTKAIECRAFTVDKELWDAIDKQLRTTYADIWEREKELSIYVFVDSSSFVTFVLALFNPAYFIAIFVTILLLYAKQ